MSQFAAPKIAAADRLANIFGGVGSAMSPKQLSDWCARRFGPNTLVQDGIPRPFDLRWILLDDAKATALRGWKPAARMPTILEENATHAEQHPNWLEHCAPR